MTENNHADAAAAGQPAETTDQRKARKFAQREAHILDAAADLLIRYGYDKTTMDDIAHAAHVSKGALYLHFAGKQELVDALMRRESERLMALVAGRVAADPSALSLFSLYRHSLLALAESPLLRALFSRDRRVLGDYARRAAALPIVQQAGTFTADFVRQFQAAGMIRRDLKPEAIAYVLLMLRYGLFIIHDFIPQEQSPPLEDISSVLAGLLESGLAVNEEPDSAAAQAAVDGLFAYAQQIMAALKQPPAAADTE